MARFLILLLLAVLAGAEVAAVMAIVEAVGPGNALAILALDMLVGIVVMRWALRSAPGERGWRLAAGGFIALPGLVLDVVGVALLIPGVRVWLRGSVKRGTESALRRRGMSVVTVTDASGARRTTVVPGDVVAGQVVPDDPGTATGRSDAGAAPGSGPSVVRGEIAGPE